MSHQCVSPPVEIRLGQTVSPNPTKVIARGPSYAFAGYNIEQ
jgi:hypothetical protein